MCASSRCKWWFNTCRWEAYVWKHVVSEHEMMHRLALSRVMAITLIQWFILMCWDEKSGLLLALMPCLHNCFDIFIHTTYLICSCILFNGKVSEFSILKVLYIQLLTAYIYKTFVEHTFVKGRLHVFCNVFLQLTLKVWWSSPYC